MARRCALLMILLAACADPVTGGADGAAADGSIARDAAAAEDARSDSGAADAIADAGAPMDAAALEDAGAPDALALDAGAPDAPAPDAAAPDAEPADAGVPEPPCAQPELAGTPTAFVGAPPALYYTFDQDHLRGSAILDVTSTHDATANPAAAALLGSAGQVGQAAALDGASTLISSAPPTSNVMSAALWIRPTRWPAAARTVILDQGHGPSAYQGWGFTILPTGRVQVFLEGGTSSANEHVATSSTCVSSGRWTHLAMTFDGSALRLYENGVLQEEIATTLPSINFGTEGLAIGRDSELASAYFEGDVDEVALFARALSATEVGQIYLAGRDGLHFVCPSRCGDVAGPAATIPQSGLVAWYRADTAVQSGPDGLVCAWCDASGGAQDLGQPTLANRPTALASGVGGQPSLAFPIVGSHFLARLTDLTITSTAGRTFIAVYRLLDRNARTNIFLHGLGDSAGSYLILEANTFNSQLRSYAVYVTNNAYDSNVATSTAAVIQTMRLDSMTVGLPVLGEVSGFVNNVPMVLTRTPGGLGNTRIETFNPNVAVLGPSTTGGAEISELLVYGRPLTEPERQQVETYLAARYGITLQ